MNLEAKKKPRSFVPLILLVIVVVAAVDQLTKTWMLRHLTGGTVYEITDWFRFRLLFNSGAAFSLGEDSTWLFTCIQLAFVVGILLYARKVSSPWIAVGLALIAGGALGNLIDRLFRAPAFFVGHVVDFISVGNFAVFNIADSAITCGVVVFVIGMLREEKENKAHA